MNTIISLTKEQLLTIVQQLAEMHILDEETVIEDNYIFIHCSAEFCRNKDTNKWTQI